MPTVLKNPATSRKSAQDALAVADAGLALAGHRVTDPYARRLAQKVAEGHMSADEAICLIVRADSPHQ